MKKPRLEEDPPNPSNSKALKMLCASIYLPKDDQSKPLGEDAHFVCADQQAIGVPDGVGGWARHGVDAGEYARELMLNSTIAVLRQHSLAGPAATIDPKSVLREAFSATRLPGSSTACVLAHSGGVLRAANVGDSGFMLFRNLRLFYRSPTQQRGFNRPYQLGNSATSDRPDCAVEVKIDVADGDVIVVGTDGLLDNLFAHKVEKILRRDLLAKKGLGLVDDEMELQNLANFIANSALYNSFKRIGESPFSEAAQQAGKFHSGGKTDDITVIVAKIVMSSSA